ncbi:MAG: TOBE domain-containing protein, partial [Chloroflexota bacterium]|nr:TOBE domain-containing protein [Chloroflexota bacterium]
SVAYLGSVTQYLVELSSSTLEVVMPSDQAPSVSPGASVGLELRAEALRLLEA